MARSTTTKREYITVAEAAQRLNCSRQNITNTIYRGNLPAELAGKVYLIRVADLERAIRDGVLSVQPKR